MCVWKDPSPRAKRRPADLTAIPPAGSLSSSRSAARLTPLRSSPLTRSSHAAFGLSAAFNSAYAQNLKREQLSHTRWMGFGPASATSSTMATATATTKTSPVSTKTDPAPAPVDARRTPLASPTAELKSNPLDAAASPKSPASSSVPAAKPAADASKPSSTTTAAPTAPAGEPDPEEIEQTSGDVINMEVFQQILDLEEDEDSFEFSLGMAQAYISQAKDAFTKMDKALLAKDLKNLGDLGHFLKGSSAALGVQKVQESCERMQNYGKRMDAAGKAPVSDAVALQRITTLLARVKREFDEAEKYLKDWYTERGLDL